MLKKLKGQQIGKTEEQEGRGWIKGKNDGGEED